MDFNRNNRPHAVVIPESLQNTHDILPASTKLNSQAEYPFGVTVTTKDEYEILSEAKLLYVSKQAALDRAQEKHPENGGGVIPGWYVIAKPSYFQVNVTRFRNKTFPAKHRRSFDDAFCLLLNVDGQDTHQRRVFRDGSDTHDGVFTGFVEKCTRESSALVRKSVIRPFAFEKVSGVEGDAAQSPNDVGVIKLRVQSGVWERQPPADGSQLSYQYDDKSISEKKVAKEGRSIQVSQKVNPFSYSWKLAPYYVGRRREMPEAGVTIYVRERSWLHSRRIIDDDDKPVSYEKFRELLEADRPKVKRTGAVDVGEEPVGKRRKTKEEIILFDVRPVQLGEVIDLT